MPFTTLKSLESQTSQIKSILDTNEEVRDKINNGILTTTSLIDDIYWRQYDYCSSILRLYASFERFVIESLQKWLDWISKNNLNFLSQSEKMISRYRYGVGEILKRSTESRFSKINIPSLIDELSSLHNNNYTKLGIEPIFATTPNLRLNDIINTLDSLELIGSSEWINSFSPLKEICENLDTTPETFLKDLVERRNEAAHGNKMPDDFWSIALIKDAASLIVILATAISEFIISKMVNIAEKENSEDNNTFNLPNIGKITETFKKHNAFVISSKNIGLWKGMRILVVTNSRCYLDTLQSIQINGITAMAWMPTTGDEIGLSITALPAKSAKVYSFDEISWF